MPTWSAERVRTLQLLGGGGGFVGSCENCHSYKVANSFVFLTRYFLRRIYCRRRDLIYGRVRARRYF